MREAASAGGIRWIACTSLQAVLGWTNSHLYGIRAGDVGCGMVDPDWGDGPLDAAKARLLDLIEDTGAKTFKYLL